MIDARQKAAQERMMMRPAAELTYEGQINDDPNQRAEYPRMMYRRTDREQTQEWADVLPNSKEPPMVINRFCGLLCDTMIANSADEAEVLAEHGWDISPQAAHGVTDGLGKQVSAKDEEIARLKAELASRDAEQVKRGPGRPPKVPVVEEA